MKIYDFDIDSICIKCALERGGSWPEGHVATWSNTPCVCCGEEYTASINDFDWDEDDDNSYKKHRD